MPLFSIPLSGLSANSDALSVISNNLANLNTTAFKGQNVTFRDLFYKSLGTTGGGDPIQVGAGAAIGSVSSNFSDGNPQSTGISTDVAIQGSGFFVVSNNGKTEYTRDGHFKVSPSGDLTTQEGQLVMGYRADTNGVVGGSLSSIQLNKGLTSPPSATTTARMNLNLNSGTVDGVSYSTPMTVYDSLGNTHVMQYTFTKTGLNQWDYSISMPAADFMSGLANLPVKDANIVYSVDDVVRDSSAGTAKSIATAVNPATHAVTWKSINDLADTYFSGGGSLTAGDVVSYKGNIYRVTANTSSAPDTTAGASAYTQISNSSYKLATGSMTFNQMGALTSLVPTGTAPTTLANVSGIHLPGLQFADGAASPNLTWDILDASGTPVLTQTAANSAPSQPYQDGCSSGTLDDYSVNADGTVEGKFSNGKTMAVAKLALATFSNLAGLERAGSNSYVATLASGEPAIGIPQAGGRGKLAGGSLEMSNVDMSKEFSSLIVTQRGFQANAKVITTFDEVTQAAINLKQ